MWSFNFTLTLRPPSTPCPYWCGLSQGSETAARGSQVGLKNLCGQSHDFGSGQCEKGKKPSATKEH
jgi:hypothetical protein